MNKKEHDFQSGRIRRASQGEAPPQVPQQTIPSQNTTPPAAPQQSLSDAAFQTPRVQQRMQAASVGMPQNQMPTQKIDPVQPSPARQSQVQPSNTRQRMPSQRMPQQSVPQHIMPQATVPQQEEFAATGKKGSASPNGGKRPKQKKSKRFKVWMSLFLVLILLVGGGAAFAMGYLDSLLNTNLLGSIIEYSPKTYSKSDMVNVLIVGIDNEEGRDYGAGLGLTDMILYASFDIQNNKLNLLQIPRDSYIGEDVPTGGTGKINAALISGEDESNPINNLVQVVEEQFMLPVDHYIAMDMDGMKAIVDTFGGLYVYVPQEMSFDGSYLPQGWQWLDGNAAEFFVRNRSGPGFEQADISRLDNQRFFYSALFRRFMNLAPQDIVNLMPVFEHYCSTDIGLTDIFDLAFTALNLQAENVMFCKVPGATDPGLDPTGQGRSLYYVDIYGRGTAEEPGVANLLNQYFRTYTEPVPAEALGLPNVTIPSNITLYSPNVQVMSSVQAEEGGADINVEPQYA